MRRILSLVSFIAILPTVAQVEGATTITFDEPEAVSNLGTQLPQLAVGGVTFASSGVPSPGVAHITPIASFDDRSPAPYPYDFISGKMLQVRGTKLQMDFSEPVLSFGFGAALNTTFNPGLMQVDLFDSGNGSLGTFYLTLDRTDMSQQGGTGSNSEGSFTASDVAGISRARITNFGDGIGPESTFSFVVDNITFQPVPESSTLVLISVGLLLATHRRCYGCNSAVNFQDDRH